ncbi:MAG: hypothetical protein H6524_02980 [Actinobacteria bacterium]|nr:hypothetical protein [Actinomycetota bacterium]
MSRLRLSTFATAAAVVGSLLVAAPAAHADDPDTTPPTVTILSPVEGQQVEIGLEPLPTVQYTCDDDVEVANCEATIGSPGSQSPITVGNGTPLDILSPGQRILTVRSTDTSGNTAVSSVQFEMVGGQQPDEIGPSIDIRVPVDGAQVKKGAVLHADYVCSDAFSGLASCEGPVPSGSRVDTSSLGVKDFTVVARERLAMNPPRPFSTKSSQRPR